MTEPRIGLHHSALLVSDLAQSRSFYEELLGLSVDATRPDLGFAGVWYALNPGAIHLLVLPNPDPVAGRPEHGGRDRHVALQVSHLAAVQARLTAAGLPFTASRSGRAALFVRDPDGNAIELLQVE